MPFLILLLLGLALAADPIPTDGDLTLQFVQAVWRHGDRSPTETCSSDKYQEDTWKFGGGGWGQLSPMGMAQHVKLGVKLANRYGNGQFVGQHYSSSEIYVRATDVNRTMISAMSNMIGMFGQNGARPGVDVPEVTPTDTFKWPGSFVPIAVHTVNDDYDYLGNPDMVCPRQSALWDFALDCPELKTMSNSKEMQDVIEILKKNCGGRVYKFTDLWAVIDAFFIERIYKRENPPFVTQDLYDKLTKLNDQAQDYVNGIGIAPYKGVDISREIGKIRGGGLLNAINDHMHLKLSCEGKNGTECKWINKLKYYVYSAHDTTVYAYLTVLGASKNVIKPEGYPHYSAAVFTELWTSKNGSQFVKVVYHKGEGDDFHIITNQSKMCKDHAVYCPLEKFNELAQYFSPGTGGPAANCANTNILNAPPATSPPTTPSTKSAGSLGMISTLFLSLATIALRLL